MESILNLLWVLIALGALGVWRVYWAREGREGHRNVLRECTAIACALVFLFFAVSLTDDLHFGLTIFDECAGARRHAAIWTGAAADSHGVKVHPAGAADLPHDLGFDSFDVTARFQAAEQISSSVLGRVSFAGRAPPVSFL